MTTAELWALAGLALCGAEMVAPGVFLLWIGLAALCTAATTALLPWGWQPQIAAFVGFALVLIAVAARRNRRRPVIDLVNAPSAGLIGATCTAIEFHGGEGRVRLRDGAWPARLEAGIVAAPGSVLRVVRLEGTTLVVR